MSSDPLAKLRALVPWIFFGILIQAGFFVAVILGQHSLPVGPLLAGDVIFTLVIIFLLWRWLGRR